MRRRSGRLARKVLGEKSNFGNSRVTQNDTFSHTTVGSCAQNQGVCNGSTMETYQEFEVSFLGIHLIRSTT